MNGKNLGSESSHREETGDDGLTGIKEVVESEWSVIARRFGREMKWEVVSFKSSGLNAVAKLASPSCSL